MPPQPPAGANLRAYLDKLELMTHLVTLNSGYTLIHSFNIVLFFTRFIEQCDFQPRLGIITRTLSLAAVDLVRARSPYFCFCPRRFIQEVSR